MLVPDIGLMMQAAFVALVQVVLLVIAFGCGVTSLVLLRWSARSAGRRLAFVSLGISVTVEILFVLYFAPWRFPNGRIVFLWPLPSLQVGLSAVVLWGLHGRRRVSGVYGLLVIATIVTMTTIGGLNLQRWDRRRENLYWANVEETESIKYQAASRAAMVCYEHIKRGRACEKCDKLTLNYLAFDAKLFHETAERCMAQARERRQASSLW
jgi:hypothetical protein